MKNVKQEIIKSLKKVLIDLGIEGVEPQLAFPQSEEHGDYSSNIAMAIFSNPNFQFQISNFKFPIELAEEIATKCKVLASRSPREAGRSGQSSRLALASRSGSKRAKFKVVERIETAPPGFINFWLSKEYLISQLQEVLGNKEEVAMETKTEILKPPKGISSPRRAAQVQNDSKRIMVEYAHPNTHKEMHIGHMRTLITGEALARLFEATGNKVFRANYQGDIGPHVAKALYGIQRIMEEENLSLKEAETWTNPEKAHFLGRGYVRGNQDYEKAKVEIDEINKELYALASQASLREAKNDLEELYQRTRQWSLDYYDEFYTRFYTKFDRLFFESEVSECGKKIVEENVGSPREAGKIFEKDEGAIVFKGGVHTRVFVTKQGYPTYEGKDICLGYKEYEAFPFDRIIHVVGSEQAGYFKVVFKALEMLDPEKFKGREEHLSMGMVTIVGMKMSSRTGELLKVDDLVDSVKSKINELIKKGKISAADKKIVAEEIAIGAVKYSVLNVGVMQNVKFDIEKSVSLDGNSGPYLQYTYARTQSVLAKAEFQISNFPSKTRLASGGKFQISNERMEPEELAILRTLYRFPEVIEDSARNMAPNTLTNYLFDLAKKFNLFYQKHPILKPQGRSTSEESELRKLSPFGADALRVEDLPPSEEEPQNDNIRNFRLALTEAVGITIKNGLNLLGIEAPDKM